MKVIIKNIQDRLLHNNENWLCVVCGDTGSGKSYSALRLAEKICPKRFNINNVVFSAEEFMSVLNSGKLRKGDVIVWDEAGVGLPAKEWYDLINKMITYIMQTFRRDNLAVIFTVPAMSLVTSDVRKLFHAYIETVSKNKRKGYVVTKFMNIERNPRTDKLYFKYLHKIEEGMSKKITSTRFFLPSSKEFIKRYEEKKAVFSETLKKDVESELKLQKIEKLKKKSLFSIEEIVQEVKKYPERYIKTYQNREYVDPHLIMVDFNIGRTKATQIKSIIERDNKDINHSYT